MVKNKSMNLTFWEARQKIKSGPLQPAYLFYGEEAYLREELQLILSAAFLGEDSQYGWEKVDGAAVPLSQALERLSGGNLFAPRRLLVVANAPYLAPPRPGIKAAESEAGEEEKEQGAPSYGAKALSADEAGLEMLERFIARQSAADAPENIILFQSHAVDRRKKLFKLLSAKGLTADCSPFKREGLSRWIKERVAGMGKTIERAALEQLLLSADSNLWHLSQELDKYAAYLNEDQKEITTEVVELLYAGDSQGNVFKLADALSEGQLLRALNLLHLLFSRREKPLQIFFMLVRHFRLLLNAFSARREKTSTDAFARSFKLHPFAAQKLYRQAARYDRETLEDILIALQKIDHQIKTGRLEPHSALEITLGQIDHLCSASRKTGTPS